MENLNTPAISFVSLDQILGSPDFKEDVVPVPEWGGHVRVRSLSKAQQGAIRERATDAKGNVDNKAVEAGILTTCVVEPALTYEHVAMLQAKIAGPIDRVLTKILELSGLTPGAVKEAERTFPA